MPAFAGMTFKLVRNPVVNWEMPAFAGMTFELVRNPVVNWEMPAFAGMTAKFALADTIDNRETRGHDTVKKTPRS